jgi:hypothetical protein
MPRASTARPNDVGLRANGSRPRPIVDGSGHQRASKAHSAVVEPLADLHFFTWTQKRQVTPTPTKAHHEILHHDDARGRFDFVDGGERGSWRLNERCERVTEIPTQWSQALRNRDLDSSRRRRATPLNSAISVATPIVERGWPRAVQRSGQGSTARVGATCFASHSSGRRRRTYSPTTTQIAEGLD